MILIHHIDIEDLEILETIFAKPRRDGVKASLCWVRPDWICDLWETASW